MESNLLQVTYAKSCVGYAQRQKDTIRTLGLSRLGETVIVSDIPSIRGMLTAVSHLVEVEPVGEVQVKAAKGDEASATDTAKAGGSESSEAKSAVSESAEASSSPPESAEDESDDSDG